MSHEALSTAAAPMREAFRNAMSRLGAAVNIVTTDGPAGVAGFTATAVCSVSDAPPTLLVCLNRNNSVHSTFRANERLCVNVLASGQQEIARMFGGNVPIPMTQRFSEKSWSRHHSGVPVLPEAIARIDCAVTEFVTVATHDVMLCKVLEVDIDSAREGLIYFDRSFHCLTATPGD